MEAIWEVRGTKSDENVLLRCKKVVLACGKRRDRLLDVNFAFLDRVLFIKHERLGKYYLENVASAFILCMKVAYNLTSSMIEDMLSFLFEAEKCVKKRRFYFQVKGELIEDRIVYNLRDLKRLLASPIAAKFSKEKVVVVGSGVSAADSVLHCLNSCIPVLHVIRRSNKQVRCEFLKLKWIFQNH